MYNYAVSNPDFMNIPSPKRKLAVRVRRIHMLILVVVLAPILTAVFVMVTGITNDISGKLAHFYSIEVVGKFNLLVSEELALIREISRSAPVIDWFADENNTGKKSAAYSKMMSYANKLQSANLYFGVQKSLNEYSIDSGTPFGNFLPFDKLDPDDYSNNWYYDCIGSRHEYVFNIDVDKITNIPQFWINHKVMDGNNLAGVLCSGILLDEMASCLFSQFNNKNVRGYIIDSRGFVQMDSHSSGFRIEDKEQPQNNIRVMYSDPLFVSAMDTYLANINGYFDKFSPAEIIKLNNNRYMYAAVVPITDTNWSVVTFYSNKALYGIEKLFPLLITMLSSFLFYTLASSICMRRMVFRPLDRLAKSLSAPNFHVNDIFGSDKNDEIGILAQTIQKMRDRLSTYNAELLRAARERERLLRIDQLTDIPNRRSLDERLPLEWGRAMRTRTPISILILDLDHFKNYNDTYGHLQGDKALQTVAKVFTGELKRSSDLAARWGGEEFAILLPDTDLKGAVGIGEQIRKKVEELQIPLADGSTSKITVSIGVNSLTPTLNNTIEGFIHDADMALYAAKREGRNRVCR